MAAVGGAPGCLRVFDPRREGLVFMHIGKAAGTSFREAVLGQPRKDSCRFQSAAGQTAFTHANRLPLQQPADPVRSPNPAPALWMAQPRRPRLTA